MHGAPKAQRWLKNLLKSEWGAKKLDCNKSEKEINDSFQKENYRETENKI